MRGSVRSMAECIEGDGALPGEGRSSPGPVASSLAAWGVAVLLAAGSARAQDAAGARRTIDIWEFRIEGTTTLPQVEVDRALLPVLGPLRSIADVEAARAALEKAYSDAGFQSVAVAIPQQTVRSGVVTLAVTETRIARLRVRGARWYLPSEIKRLAPSMAEGLVPNFKDLVRDVAVLNQQPDRRVTPAIKTGREPATIDVDLNVADRIPLHAAADVNNRHGRDTTPLRTNLSLRYENLWQLGHALFFAAQLAPQRYEDGRSYVATYTARFADAPWLAVVGSWFDQGSDLSTVGGISVVGVGQIVGVRAQLTLPASEGFFHVASVGVDRKRFKDRLELADSALTNPITYVPFAAQYTAAWDSGEAQTTVGASTAVNLRGVSSGTEAFDAKRYGAFGSFVVLRADAARTDHLWRDLQLALRAQLQYSPDPLVASEQLGVGGSETVRGYLESEALGDFGACGSIELRSPSFVRSAGYEWRLHAFVDGAWVGVHRPLPDTVPETTLAGFGGGTSVRLAGRVSGVVQVALPLRTTAMSPGLEPRVHFRVGTEF